MELNVRLFALYRERAGQNIIKVAVGDGATVASSGYVPVPHGAGGAGAEGGVP